MLRDPLKAEDNAEILERFPYLQKRLFPRPTEAELLQMQLDAARLQWQQMRAIIQTLRESIAVEHIDDERGGEVATYELFIDESLFLSIANCSQRFAGEPLTQAGAIVIDESADEVPF